MLKGRGKDWRNLPLTVAGLLVAGAVCGSFISACAPAAVDAKLAAGAGSPDTADIDAASDLVELFKSEGLRWLRGERELYRDRATPLSVEDRQVLGAYFSEPLLEQARVLVVPRFEKPEFFSIFKERDEPYPVDFRRAAALALIDTILVRRDVWNSPARQRVLFHELVHAVQFEVLGVEGYMNGYVDTWAENGRRYRSIPHEELAYDLAARFGRSEGLPFSVETEVRSRLAAAVSE